MFFHFIGRGVPDNSCVDDWVSASGGWDWDRLRHVVPVNVLQHIAACPAPNSLSGDDVPCWRWTAKRAFTTKSAYVALGDSSNPNSSVWRVLWKVSVPQRVRTFLWLAVHGKLLTNQERVRRSLTTVDACFLCNNGSKDVLHVLRDCIRARTVWRQVIQESKWEEFMSLNSYDWFVRNLSQPQYFIFSGGDLIAQFAIICWILWIRRNKCLFDRDHIERLSVLAECQSMLEAMHFQQEVVQPPPYSPSIWHSPHSGWVKANVDGAVIPVDLTAACGGVLRDDSGQWLLGFSRSLGCCSVLFAELWGVHDVLKHAWSMGCRKVIIETDSADVADLFSSRQEDLRGYIIASTVRQMLNLDWEVTVCKISRVCNRVADALAKASRGLPVGEIIYHAAPHFVHDLLREGF
ncbi:hypothetical protein GQ457_16G009340 [Hibiscus cannabinus]